MSETEKKPKYGGRQKGTPNKRSQEVHDKAKALGVDPFEILLLFAKGDANALGYRDPKDKISMDMRLNAAKEACTYLYSKKKAITLNTNISDLPVRAFAFPNPKQEEGNNENGNNDNGTN